jgi:hypothetical protein
MPVPEVQASAQTDVAALRAEGPAALQRLLKRWDAAGGPDREGLAALIDQVAAQRYATVSRMFWYTDLEAAEAAAKAEGKPILSLRLLGRLDEDLSCANSRFFRVALYGNAELSAWLREHFILHWSSERPVPKLTIDMGDGRRIETTVTGNSAHYVLDADGHVVDVIPGLMTPRAFRHELEGALELVGTDDLAEYAAHHEAARVAIGEEWRRLADMSIPERTYASELAAAERATMSKAMVEIPTVKTAKLGGSPQYLSVESEAWEQIGVHLLDALGLERSAAPAGRVAPPPEVLDAQSRGLLADLAPVDWIHPDRALDERGLAALTRRFEGSIVADTAINLLRLRDSIHSQLAYLASVGQRPDFATVNEWLYSSLFRTARADQWLGLATPGVFTGLPADGVVTD